MVPICTALHQLELVNEGFTRRYAVEVVGDARHAIHCAGQDNAMPVNGAGFFQVIGDAQSNRVAFLEAQRRRRQRAVNRGGDTGSAGKVNALFTNGKIENLARQSGLSCLSLLDGGVQNIRFKSQAGQ